eukprot:scaffold15726_cov200-Alexandrium_tamarense.AAC.8
MNNPPPPPKGSAPSGGGGLGKSAPIRTLPAQISGGVPVYGLSQSKSKQSAPVVGAPSSSASARPTAMEPPQIKEPQPVESMAFATASGSVAHAVGAQPAYATGGTAYATRNPMPCPPRSAQPPQLQQIQLQQQISNQHINPPQFQSYDPSTQAVPPPTATDQVEKAMLSPPGGAPRQSDDPLQPHIVALPPPEQTTQLSPRQQTQVHPLGGGRQIRKQTNVQMQQQSFQQPTHQSVVSTQQYQSPQQTYQQQSQPTQLSVLTSPEQPTVSPKQKSHPSTPDEEVDAFLLNTTPDTYTQNQSPELSASVPNVAKIRPTPLPPTQSILAKVKLLAVRRAWGDVIRVTNDALIVKNMDSGKGGITAASTTDGGGHHSFYSELVTAASSSTLVTTHAASDSMEKLREETCELIILRFISHLKLRRYVDLGKEIAQLGLIPHLPPHSSSIASNSEVTAVPPSPGTEVVPLSSVPASNAKNATASMSNTTSMAWKEGSLHSSESEDKVPSWVPYGLRILAAQQLQYIDGSSKAIDVLFDMRDRAVRTDYWNTQGMEVWRPTIDNALVNAFVRKREWRLALNSLENLLNGLEESVVREVEWWCRSNTVVEAERSLMKELILSSASVELLSRQILILLQSGALAAAHIVQSDVNSHSTRVREITSSQSTTQTTLAFLQKESTLVRQVPIRQLVNEGLLLFACANYSDATKCFRDALYKQKELGASSEIRPSGCPSFKELASPTLGFDADSSLTVESLNNLSLCLLYSGNMRLAVQELEGLVREDPTLYLTEGMAFNMCTLYELGSDGEECTRRKKILQRVAKRFFLHDVGVESFRLN